MNKTKLLGLLLPLLTLGLAGCGAKEEEPKPVISDWKNTATKHWRESELNGEKTNIDEAAHTFVEETEKAVATSCVADGKKFEKCSICGYEKETKINKVDHVLSVDAAKSTTASCSVAGKKVEKCANCTYEKTTDLGKLPHTISGTGTAKNDGRDYIEYECSVCHTKIENRIQFKNHTLTAGTFESGKLSQDPVGEAVWEIQLPAGQYDVYFEAKCSSSGAGKTLSERSVVVKYNDVEVTFDKTQTDETLEISQSNYTAFSFCRITATGGIDKLLLQNPHYRFVFDADGYITFKPVVA